MVCNKRSHTLTFKQAHFTLTSGRHDSFLYVISTLTPSWKHCLSLSGAFQREREKEEERAQKSIVSKSLFAHIYHPRSLLLGQSKTCAKLKVPGWEGDPLRRRCMGFPQEKGMETTACPVPTSCGSPWAAGIHAQQIQARPAEPMRVISCLPCGLKQDSSASSVLLRS